MFLKASQKDGKDILLKQRNQKIQAEFRSRLGLLIDMLKQDFGFTNDRNTVRKFFKNYKISAEITGVDENIIFLFYFILQTLSYGRNLNFQMFKKYCSETADLYVNPYSWYYMPSNVHTVILYGLSIAKSFTLHIRLLNEEALESRNIFPTNILKYVYNIIVTVF